MNQVTDHKTFSYSNVVGISAIGHNTASNSNEIARTHMIKLVSTEMNVQIEIHCNQITSDVQDTILKILTVS